MSRFAKDASPDRVHPECPRPQMVREDWLNLNGLWDHAVAGKEAPQPPAWQGKILVPFPIESALSGVRKVFCGHERLWYCRTFDVPKGFRGKRLLLHFGAVDWEAVALVNNRDVGTHRGGYDAFTFDVTEAIKPDGIYKQLSDIEAGCNGFVTYDRAVGYHGRNRELCAQDLMDIVGWMGERYKGKIGAW